MLEINTKSRKNNIIHAKYYKNNLAIYIVIRYHVCCIILAPGSGSFIQCQRLVERRVGCVVRLALVFSHPIQD